MNKEQEIVFRWLGTRDWGEAHALQLRIRDRVVLGSSPGEVLMMEHPAVITAGRQASRRDLQISAEALRARGITFVQSERGGHLTLHLPGQLVFYPIIPLQSLRMGVNQYVRVLAETLVEWLSVHQLSGEWKDDAPGVWVGPNGSRKIASVGIHVHKQVPIHGASLNLSPDLALFQMLRPCGFSSNVMTSFEAEGGTSLSVEEAARQIAPVLAEKLGVKWGGFDSD